MSIKLNILGRRRPGTTLAEHRHHIRTVHGEAVLRFIEVAPDSAPRRYVQNAVFDGQFRNSSPGGDPFALNRDFVTQVWVDDFAMLEASRRHPFYLANLKDDEDRFVDQATVVFLPCHEREIATRGAIPAAAVKLFMLTQRAVGVDPVDYASAWRRAAQAAGTLPLRHVQNDVVLPKGAVPPADAIDEFWLPDEVTAYAFLKEWSAVLHKELIEPGLASAAGIVALLAREDVIHSGLQPTASLALA